MFLNKCPASSIYSAESFFVLIIILIGFRDSILANIKFMADTIGTASITPEIPQRYPQTNNDVIITSGFRLTPLLINFGSTIFAIIIWIAINIIKRSINLTGD